MHLALDPPQMPVPALSCCVGLQNMPVVPLTLWPSGSLLTVADLDTLDITVMEPSTVSKGSVGVAVFHMQKPTKQPPFLRDNSFISDIRGVMQ